MTIRFHPNSLGLDAVIPEQKAPEQVHADLGV